MAEHLSNEILDSYRRKTLRGELRFNADIHLAECLACSEKLRQKEKLQSLFQTVRANLRYVTEGLSEHLSDEQFVSYAKSQLDDVEHEIVASHLTWCEDCNAEFKEMRSIISQFETEPEKSVSAWGRLKARAQTVWENGLQSIQTPMLRGAFVLMIALFVPFALWRWGLFDPPDKEKPPANLSSSQQTTVAATATNRDSSNVSGDNVSAVGSLSAKLPDASGDLNAIGWLLSSDQRLFEKARRGGFEISPVIGGFADTTMGAEPQKKDSFRLLGPGSKVIRETNPTMRWQALEGASKYRVVLTNVSNGGMEIADLFVTETQWQPAHPLERGHRYTWQITADKSGSSVYGLWANRTYADFFILAEKELAQVRKAETHYKSISDPLAHIALAARYAKAGLVEEAKRELRSFPKGHPQSVLAAQLLETLSRKVQKY